MENKRRPLFLLVPVALAACASLNTSRLLPADRQPILVLNGEIRSCQNQRRTAVGACEAATRIPAEQVVRSLVFPPQAAQVYYGSRGIAGAHLVVTTDFRAAPISTGGATMVYVVGGSRYNCPPARLVIPEMDGCVPNLPPVAPDQVESVEVIRSPASVHLFGPYASGGAVIITMKTR